MKITIGAYDPTTRTVAARFEEGEIVHDRSVNACRDSKGGYDLAATKLRVDDVGRGVQAKIAAGAITPPVDLDPSPDAG